MSIFANPIPVVDSLIELIQLLQKDVAEKSTKLRECEERLAKRDAHTQDVAMETPEPRRSKRIRPNPVTGIEC